MPRRRNRSPTRGGRSNVPQRDNQKVDGCWSPARSHGRSPGPPFNDRPPFRSSRSRSRERNFQPQQARMRRSRSPRENEHWPLQRGRSPNRLKPEADMRHRAVSDHRRGRSGHRRELGVPHGEVDVREEHFFPPLERSRPWSPNNHRRGSPRAEVHEKRENFFPPDRNRPCSPVNRRLGSPPPEFHGRERESHDREREEFVHPRFSQPEEFHRPRLDKDHSPPFKGRFVNEHTPQFHERGNNGRNHPWREGESPDRFLPVKSRGRSRHRSRERSPQSRSKGPPEPRLRGDALRSPSPRGRPAYEHRGSPIHRRLESPMPPPDLRGREEPLYSPRERPTGPPITEDTPFKRHENMRPPEFYDFPARHEERPRSPRPEKDYGPRDHVEFRKEAFPYRQERKRTPERSTQENWMVKSRSERQSSFISNEQQIYRDGPPGARDQRFPPRFDHEPQNSRANVPPRRSPSPIHHRVHDSPPRGFSPVRVDWGQRERELSPREPERRMRLPQESSQNYSGVSLHNEQRRSPRRPEVWADEPPTKKSAQRPSPRRKSTSRHISPPRHHAVNRAVPPRVHREPNPSFSRKERSPQRGRKRSWSPPRREEIKVDPERNSKRRSRSPVRNFPDRRNRLITPPPPPIIGSVSEDHRRSSPKRTPPIVRRALGMRDKSPTLAGGRKQDDTRLRVDRKESGHRNGNPNGRSAQARRRSASPSRGNRRRSKSPPARPSARSPPRSDIHPMPPLQNLIRESELRERGRQAMEIEHLRKMDELRRAMEYRERIRNDPGLIRAAIESREADMERARIMQEMDMRNRPTLVEAVRHEVTMSRFDRGPPMVPPPGIMRPILPAPHAAMMHPPQMVQPPASFMMPPPPFRKF